MSLRLNPLESGHAFRDDELADRAESLLSLNPLESGHAFREPQRWASGPRPSTVLIPSNRVMHSEGQDDNEVSDRVLRSLNPLESGHAFRDH